MPNMIDGTPFPTFPSTWYHPVYGAREVQSFEDFQKLDNDWRATAAKADMDRTDTEAQIAIAHNMQVKLEMIDKLGDKAGTTDVPLPPPGAVGGVDRAHTEFAFSKQREDGKKEPIVRNSVQAQESLDRGYAEPL